MEDTTVRSIVAVNAIMIYDGEILVQKVVKKNNTLGIPGGKVEGEESFEEALFREIQEETGITPDQYSYQKIAILHERPQVTCKHIYILQMNEKVEKFSYAGSEISDCFWMKFEDIPTDTDAYRNAWVYYIIRDYLKGHFDKSSCFYNPFV